MFTTSPRRETIILWFFILLKMLLHFFLIHPDYDLHRDEYLHLDQAKHLAWGFESVPPFTSWISLIILWLGNGVFWIKFFPALFGALTLVVVWKATEALKGGLFALVLGATAITFSVIMRLNILYQPNSFDVLCWTFCFYTFLRYIQTDNPKWLMWTAVGFAVGFLNKYNILFLVMGLLPAITLTHVRKIFKDKYLYISLAIALIMVLPNLVWQYQNGFPVVQHMKALTETQLVNVSRVNFLKEQLLFFLGALYILLAAFISLFIYPPFKPYRVFGWSFLFTMLIFLYFKAKSYYAIGLYPIFFAFGSVYLEYLLNKGWKIYLRPVLIILLVICFVPFFKIAFPTMKPKDIEAKATLMKQLGLLRWEDGKDHPVPQDFADMLGWSELARKVDSVYQQIEDKQNTIVLCDNYGQAGAINYYTKHKDLQALSLNADYINWFPFNSKNIQNVILVQERDDTDKSRTRERQFFKTVKFTGSIEDPLARETGTSIYLLEHATTSINKILQEEIRKYRGNR